MTSLARQINRRADRKNGIIRDVAPQTTILLPNGGYRTLHPTKGWRTVSPKRVAIYK